MIKIPVVCYSRVVGYFSPVNQWNKGKKEEFKDRKTLKNWEWIIDENNGPFYNSRIYDQHKRTG